MREIELERGKKLRTFLYTYYSSLGIARASPVLPLLCLLVCTGIDSPQALPGHKAAEVPVHCVRAQHGGGAGRALPHPPPGAAMS